MTNRWSRWICGRLGKGNGSERRDCLHKCYPGRPRPEAGGEPGPIKSQPLSNRAGYLGPGSAMQRVALHCARDDN